MACSAGSSSARSVGAPDSPGSSLRKFAAIQLRAFEVVPYIPTGQWVPKTAYRKTVKGIIEAPPFLMWNVEKV